MYFQGFRLDAIKNGYIIELKNYNWANYKYYGGLASKFAQQAKNYQNFVGDNIRGEIIQGVIFYFSSSPPDIISDRLKEMGIIVKYVGGN